MIHLNTSRTCHRVLALVALAALLLLPAPALAQAELVINSFTIPATASPGQITTGALSVSNVGDQSASLSSVNVSVSSPFGLGSSFLVQNPGQINSGATVNLVLQLEWAHSAPAGARDIDVTVFYFNPNSFRQVTRDNAATVTIGAPVVDLTVQSVEPSQRNISLSETLQVDYSVRYSAPSQSFRLINSSRTEFYLSTNSTFEPATDQKFDSVDFISLQANATSTQTANLRFTRAMNPGTYFLVAEADAGESVLESSESNNTRVSSNSTVVGAPVIDLVLESLDALTPSTAAFSRLPVTYVVAYNAPSPQGFDFISNSIKVRLSVNGTLERDADPFVGDISIFMGPQTREGQQVNLNVPATIAPGSYRLIGEFDPISDSQPIGEERESNENNNVFVDSGTLTITANPVDITIVSLTPLSLTTSIDSTLPVTAVLRYSAPDNGFPGASFNVNYRLSADNAFSNSDVQLGSSFFFLNPGETDGQSTVFQVPDTLAPGSYFLVARADTGSSVPEANETNNDLTAASRVNITGPAGDLQLFSVQSLVASTSVTAAFPLTYSGRYVTPAGVFSSVSVSTRFFFSRDQTFDANDLEFQSDFEFPAPNASFGQRLNSPSILQADPGDYFIIAVTDRDNSVPEASETNNVAASASRIRLTRPADDHADFASTVDPVRDVLPIGNPAKGEIDYPRDVDVFAVQAVRGRPLIITGRATFTARVQLFDQDGLRLLAEGIFSSGSPNRIGYTSILTSGTYYVQIRETNNTGIGMYTLEAEQFEADLRPLSVNSPNAISLTDPLPITASIELDVFPTGPSPVFVGTEFFLSSDRVFNRNFDTLIGSASTNISTGAPNSVVALGNIPDTLTPGSYFLVVNADSGKALQETNENNNVFITAAPILVRAANVDVTVSSLQLFGSSFSASQLLPLTFTVSLTPTAAAVPAVQRVVNTRLLLSTDNVVDGNDRELFPGPGSVNIAPGGTAGRRVDVELPSNLRGTFNVLFVADPFDGIAESDENNNVRSAGPITIGTPVVDLSIALTPLATQAAINEPLPVTASVFYSAPTTDFPETSVFLSSFLSTDRSGSNRTFASENFPTFFLQPGERVGRQGTVTIPSGLVPGSYFLGIELGLGTTIAETSAANNIAFSTSPISIVANPADAVLLDFSTTVTQTFVLGTVPTSVTVQLIDDREQAVRSSTFVSVNYFVTTFPLTAQTNLSGLVSLTSSSFFLNGGDTRTSQVPLTLFSNMPAGNYFFSAVIDRFNSLGEANRSNNFRSFQVRVNPSATDFRFLDLTTGASSASVGDSIPMSVTVAYDAPSATNFPSLSLNIAGYLSQDATLERLSDTLLGSVSESLLPASSESRQFGLPLPATVAPGDYFIIGELDPNQSFPESNETNNVRANAKQIAVGAPRTDLVISSFGATRNTVLPSQTLPITAAVRYDAPSIGYPDASVQFEARVSSDGKLDSSDPRLGGVNVFLRPGQSSDVLLVGSVPAVIPPGSYSLIGSLDPSLSFPDGNRANNVFVSPSLLSIGATGSDLFVQSVSITPRTTKTGGQVTAQATFGYNVTGDASLFPSASVQTEFFFFRTPQFDRYSASASGSRNTVIAPNTTVTVQQQISAPFASGTWFLAAGIDRFENVADFNRTNNLLFDTVPITTTFTQATGDLSIAPFFLTTSTIPAGTSFSQPYTVTYLDTPGGADSIGFDVDFFLTETSGVTGTISLGNDFFTINRGATFSDRAALFVPRNVPAGNYFVEARIDFNGDPDRSNNQAFSTNGLLVGPIASNLTPTASLGADRTIASFRPFTLTGSFFDHDGDPVTTTFSQVSGVPAISPTTGSRIRIPGQADGVSVFRFTVVDQFGLSSSDDITMTFRPQSELGPIVDTVAGGLEKFNFAADGTRATAFLPFDVKDVDLDGAGNIFLLERNANRVRRIDNTTRLVSTVAGEPVTGSVSAAGKTEQPVRSTGAGFFGDGGPATQALFGFPEGITVDSGGTLQIADTVNHRIREVFNGIVNTVAGGGDTDPFGRGGFSGDGQAATLAALRRPSHAVKAGNGDLFIADTGNHRIRRVRAGIITTLAGTGLAGSSGDNGPATLAALNTPTRLALDTQNGLLITERDGHRVRRVDLVTGSITTVAGTGATGFNGDGLLGPQTAVSSPDGIDADNNAVKYIADSGNRRVRRVDGLTGTVSTLAGTGGFGNTGDAGSAFLAQLRSPQGMALDTNKNVFFVDGTDSIRTIIPPVSLAGLKPAITLQPTDEFVTYSTANDQSAASGGVQALVVYGSLPISGVNNTNNHTLELTVVNLDNPADTATYTSVATNGTVTFQNVNLSGTDQSRYSFRLRDLTNQTDLSRQLAVRGSAPVAFIQFFDVDNRGPRLIEANGFLSSDPDGQSLAFRWEFITKPASADELDPGLVNQSFIRYRAQQAGTYILRLTVTDPTGLSSSREISFRVINSPPVADPGPKRRQFLLPNPASTVPSSATTTLLVLDGSASTDPDGDPIFYTWSVVRKTGRSTPTILAPNAPVTLVQFSDERNPDGLVLDAGRYQFTLTVTDTLGLSSSRVVEVLALDPANVIPSANAGLDRAVAITRLATGIAQDVPDVLSPLPVAFVRLDGRESADSPRTANGVPRPLAYRWTTLSAPAGSVITSPAFPNRANTPLPQFVPDLPGIYTFELVVNNGQFDSVPDQVSIDVSIRDLNAPPTADFRVRDVAGNRVSGLENPVLIFRTGDLVTLDGTFSSDRDDPNQLRYQWTQVDGDRVSLAPSELTSKPSFQPVVTGNYEFDLVVTDPKGAASRPARGRIVVVSPSDTLPVLSLRATATGTAGVGLDFGDELTEGVTSSLTVQTGALVTLTATVVDPDVSVGGQRLSYVFTQVSGPTVALTTGAFNVTDLQSQVQFTPTTSRVHVFECRVVALNAAGQPTGVEVRRFIRVRVNSPTNAVPFARARVLNLPKDTFGVCQPVQLSGDGSVDVGPNATGSVQFRWTQVAGPAVVFSDPFSMVTTFVIPDLGTDEDRDLVFALVVDDGNDQSEPVNVFVTLSPNTPQTFSLDTPRGLDLISVPISPTASAPFTAADLANLANSPFVVRVAQGSEGQMRFELWNANLGLAPFAIQGNEGYLVRWRRQTSRLDLAGRNWQSSQLGKPLGQGLNLVSYPRGAPGNETAETLLTRSGANYAVRFNNATGKFEVYLRGVGLQPFPVERGRSYLLSAPSSRTLTLPTCAQ